MKTTLPQRLQIGLQALEQADHDLTLALRHPHQKAEVILAWLHLQFRTGVVRDPEELVIFLSDILDDTENSRITGDDAPAVDPQAWLKSWQTAQATVRTARQSATRGHGNPRITGKR